VYFGLPSISAAPKTNTTDSKTRCSWLLGPTYFLGRIEFYIQICQCLIAKIDDLLSTQTIHVMFVLGPFYCWNYQISNLSRYQTYDIINHENLSLIKEQDYPNLLGPLDLSTIPQLTVMEDKILFAINARAQVIDPDSLISETHRDNTMVLINTADIRGNSKAILTGERK